MKRILPILLTILLAACQTVAAFDLEIGRIYTAPEVKQWAIEKGYQDVVDALNRNTPSKRFVSDGCSGPCPQTWKGHDLQPACVHHDALYYAGGSQFDKLKADAQLMLDVAQETGDIEWAVTMFNSVHFFGNNPLADYGWGNVGVDE